MFNVEEICFADCYFCVGNEHFIHAQSTTARNLESFSIELDLKLRKHRPRFAGIQTQVFDVRKCQLDQNQQRFERWEIYFSQVLAIKQLNLTTVDTS